jgi:hypothetical protein
MMTRRKIILLQESGYEYIIFNDAGTPVRMVRRRNWSAWRTAVTAAGRPKRAMASAAASALRISSTDGNSRSRTLRFPVVAVMSLQSCALPSTVTHAWPALGG